MMFSITIPAYKRAYLHEAIESCLAQTYFNFELVIVDDASPEDLYSIVEEFHDERIRYYRNEKNCGAIDVVDNWNKCLEFATGDYIICMGDDDKLLPNCLQEYVNLMDKYPNLGVYHAWTEIIDEKGTFVEWQIPRPEYESAYSLLWNRWVVRRRQYIGDFLFNVDCLRKNGGFYKLPLAWASDDITALIAAKDTGIANTQVPTFQYRENRYTISRTGNTEVKLQAVLLSKKWYELFLAEKPSNDLDYKYWILLQDFFDKHFDYMLRGPIKQELETKSVFRLVYWYKQRKKYNLNSFVFKRLLKDSFEKLFR